MCIAGFAGTKYYGPHPSTYMGHRDDRAHQPGEPRAPIKTAPSVGALADVFCIQVTKERSLAGYLNSCGPNKKIFSACQTRERSRYL